MWNATGDPDRIIELLTPAGSEDFYSEASAAPDDAAFEAVCARYGIRFFPDSPWNERLRNQFGLAE